MIKFTPPTYDELMDEMEEIRRFQTAMSKAFSTGDFQKVAHNELRGQMIRCQENLAKWYGQDG